MTSFDPSANYCVTCGVRMDALDHRSICDSCHWKQAQADRPDDEPLEDSSPTRRGDGAYWSSERGEHGRPCP